MSALSRRTFHETTTNALTNALRARRSRGEAVIDLTVSNPTTAGIAYPSAEILAALANPRALVYEPEPFGIASARECVARALTAHGMPIDASRIALTASTSEAYSFLFKVLCDPGDEVLVAQPSYPLFDLLASFESVKLVPYRLAYDGEWHVDVDSLRRARTPRTRAILVVTPNNPTGSFLKRDELAAMAAMDLPIVSDEVFAPYALKDDPHRAVSALEATDALVFALSGLSKLAALPQMKVGWIAAGGPKSRVDEAISRIELVADSFLSVGTPVQHALPTLLATRSIAANAIMDRTRANLAVLRASIAPTSPLSILDVEGGWYATLRLPRTQSEEAWAIELLERDGVYVHPGHFFDFAEEAYVVVSLLTPAADFAAGAGRIAARVAASSG